MPIRRLAAVGISLLAGLQAGRKATRRRLPNDVSDILLRRSFVGIFTVSATSAGVWINVEWRASDEEKCSCARTLPQPDAVLKTLVCVSSVACSRKRRIFFLWSVHSRAVTNMTPAGPCLLRPSEQVLHTRQGIRRNEARRLATSDGIVTDYYSFEKKGGGCTSLQRKCPNERARETGDPRENPPTDGIVRRDSHLRKSSGRPGRGLNSVEGEQPLHTPPRPPEWIQEHSVNSRAWQYTAATKCVYAQTAQVVENGGNNPGVNCGLWENTRDTLSPTLEAVIHPQRCHRAVHGISPAPWTPRAKGEGGGHYNEKHSLLLTPFKPLSATPRARPVITRCSRGGFSWGVSRTPSSPSKPTDVQNLRHDSRFVPVSGVIQQLFVRLAAVLLTPNRQLPTWILRESGRRMGGGGGGTDYASLNQGKNKCMGVPYLDAELRLREFHGMLVGGGNSTLHEQQCVPRSNLRKGRGRSLKRLAALLRGSTARVTGLGGGGGGQTNAHQENVSGWFARALKHTPSPLPLTHNRGRSSPRLSGDARQRRDESGPSDWTPFSALTTKGRRGRVLRSSPSAELPDVPGFEVDRRVSVDPFDLPATTTSFPRHPIQISIINDKVVGGLLPQKAMQFSGLWSTTCMKEEYPVGLLYLTLAERNITNTEENPCLQSELRWAGAPTEGNSEDLGALREKSQAKDNLNLVFQLYLYGSRGPNLRRRDKRPHLVTGWDSNQVMHHSGRQSSHSSATSTDDSPPDRVIRAPAIQRNVKSE
ncbi:hypothetical protein PR048_019477 [Dryococelus australis]|uniref:Uncharacterized protein n=1 Tax=Dryococelus australis TaxID=614101 RepID=A0ABQ9H3L3_9NEOP|nr:hypothetical protein PR048_019477 [Dryococelus australis]